MELMKYPALSRDIPSCRYHERRTALDDIRSGVAFYGSEWIVPEPMAPSRDHLNWTATEEEPSC